MNSPRLLLSKLIFSVTPPCEDITRIVSRSYDKPSSLKEKIQVQAHILFCRSCHRFVHQLEYLQTIVAKILSDDSFPGAKAELNKETQVKMQSEINKALENFNNQSSV